MATDLEPCPRFGKWIGGCKFEPRYERSPPTIAPTWLRGRAILFEEDVAAIAALSGEGYCGDVCIRCGKQVKATKGGSNG